MNSWPSPTVAELQAEGVLLVEDGNHGEYRPRPQEFVEGGTAFVRAADLADGQVTFSAVGTINDVALARIRKGIGRSGDILFSHKGTVGKLARVPENAPPFVCSPQTTFWRVLDEVRLRRDYLYAYMRSTAFIDQWWMRKGETDMADYVSLSAQRQLRIVLPPTGVQERIAKPLAAIDDLIENNRRRIQVLEDMARRIYYEWLVRFRFPGFEERIFRDAPMGLIPEGWKVAPLSTLVDIGRDTVDARRVASGLPAVGLEHIPRRQLTLDNWGVAGDLQSRKTEFQSGDILFGKIRPYFHKVSVAPLDGICSTDAIVVRPREPYWGVVVMTLSTNEFVGHATQTATGTKMPRADWRVIGDYRVAVPPEGLAERFTHLIRTHLDAAKGLMFASRNLARMRDLLLPKLITGQIDVARLDLDKVLEATA
jgi:type I restriction enzyme, S subunit